MEPEVALGPDELGQAQCGTLFFFVLFCFPFSCLFFLFAFSVLFLFLPFSFSFWEAGYFLFNYLFNCFDFTATVNCFPDLLLVLYSGINAGDAQGTIMAGIEPGRARCMWGKFPLHCTISFFSSKVVFIGTYLENLRREKYVFKRKQKLL